MQEEDLYKGCPLPTATAETGSVNSYLQAEVPVRQAAKDNGGFGGRTKKNLRLSKEQYGFLEDSFKEHSTLTPVGVLITIWPPYMSVKKEITCPVVFLEKSPDVLRLKWKTTQLPKEILSIIQLYIRSHCRMTKQQQTKEDCENLKRGCAALTQENRRLQGEVAELRALLTNPASFTATTTSCSVPFGTALSAGEPPPPEQRGLPGPISLCTPRKC
ncbi:unnamed protein product [Miscanthus lutarioriparius]|uniref:Leucine zipper homeobox-associated domain-containing protein n=1 Tax=Miscanthus lutarioriparius TaxID=422564 RepID=A0A811R9R5_9POAL|nr:unnamed protein product [Miscanthus lutarioriparius]